MFKRLLWTAAVLTFIFPVYDHGQGNMTIELSGVRRVRFLGAIVEDPSGTPMNGVLVEACSPDWKTVLRSTTTDAKGKFVFPRGTGGALHYFQVTAPGLDLFRLRVEVDRLFGKTLHTRMHFGT